MLPGIQEYRPRASLLDNFVKSGYASVASFRRNSQQVFQLPVVEVFVNISGKDFANRLSCWSPALGIHTLMFFGCLRLVL